MTTNRSNEEVDRVLDYGCGDGRFSTMLAKLGADFEGFDISESGISVAREYARLNNVADSGRFPRNLQAVSLVLALGSRLSISRKIRENNRY